MAARRGSGGNPARRTISRSGESARRIAQAKEELLELDRVAPPFSIAYFGVEPQWLTDDLDQPLDRSLHRHSGDQIMGAMLHLPSSDRGESIAEASRGFTQPFIAVPRWNELPWEVDTHAVVTAGADWTTRKTMDGLRIIQAARRLARLHFSAMIGLDTAQGEFAPKDPSELQDLVNYIGGRLQLEVTIASEPFRTVALSMDKDGWLATQLR
ncbi:hypothetical protein [Glaciihabitans sp. UYNi722]|uniref:hypothetical protein n=1 Tax=Glaciihabitans sp. UYNi722 TaxID=3156344 RepID=UPI00339AD5DD